MNVHKNSSNSTGGSLVYQSISRVLVAPISVLVFIPVLVICVGLTITLLSHTSARRNMHDFAGRRFAEVVSLIDWEMNEVLHQGEASLQELHDFVERHGVNFSAEIFIGELEGQFRNHSTLAFLGVGDPAGNYTGIFQMDSRQSDSELCYTRRRMQPNGRTHLKEYNISETPHVLMRDDPAFGYDPRTRPWYLEAVREKSRILSDPYPWYDSGLIGITLAEPLFLHSGELLSVIEIDFNLNSLSRKIEQLEERFDTRIMIHSRKGEVIALSGFRQRAGRDREGRGNVPRLEDVEDPVFQRYFSGSSMVTPNDENQFQYEIDGERFLGVSRSIPLPGEKVWKIVCVGSLDEMLLQSNNSMRKSIIISLTAMLIAAGFAAVFSRLIVTTHIRANKAEAEARQAHEKVRILEGYQLLRRLGKGGMGEVWLGEHKMLARPVAIKLIHSDRFHGDDPAVQRTVEMRFQREARALARLQSPHTIKIYDFGISEDGTLFYVMELLDGINLRQLVQQFGPQPPERVRSILEDVASSLMEAHGHNLIHRDIKPDNIFLGRQLDHFDQVTLIDFGLVRHADRNIAVESMPELTVEGAITGTPAYMAPEQASEDWAENLDASVDIYSLALVGWYLLTGKDLYGRKTQVSTIMAQVQDPVPTVEEFKAAGIDAGMGELLGQCLAKSAEGRLAHAHELVTTLQQLKAETDPEGTAWTVAMQKTWWKQVPTLNLNADDDKNVIYIHHRKNERSILTGEVHPEKADAASSMDTLI